MRTIKCINCGEPMIAAYTRDGLCVWLCPHAKIKRLNVLNAAIHCKTAQPEPTAPQASLTYATTRYSKAVKTGTSTEALKIAFDQLTRDTDLTLDKLKGAVYHTASEEQILKCANLAITLELPMKDLPELFNAAMKLGYALGITTEKAIESLTIGIGRQSRLVLDNIGIVFRATEAYAWFADQVGLTKLTETQRRKAWIAYAIKLIKEKAEMLEITPNSKKVEVEQHQAKLKDRHAKLGERVLQQH